MSDRTIHAAYDGMEIVRYDRAGKWYLEPTNVSLPRQQVTIKEAVRMAAWGIDNAAGSWFPDLPGGQSFDALMRRVGAA